MGREQPNQVWGALQVLMALLFLLAIAAVACWHLAAWIDWLEPL